VSTIVREEPTTQAPAPPPVRVAGRTVYRLTADQVLRMIDAGIVTSHTNAELIDGVLYEMTKGELHNAIVNVVGDLLRPLVALAPERHHVRLESSNTADPYSLPEPDVSVVAGGVFDYVPTPPPLTKLGLVIEVDNSRSSDDTDKLAKYARAAIPTYWMIDAPGRVVVVSTQPNANGGYDRREIRRPGDTLDVVIGGHACGTVRVADLFPPATPG
jgi:Uma2 family endonuclease